MSTEEIAPKRGRGQPPKPPEASRTVRIVVRVTPSESAAIERAAEGGTTSGWARRLLLAAAGVGA